MEKIHEKWRLSATASYDLLIMISIIGIQAFVIWFHCSADCCTNISYYGPSYYFDYYYHHHYYHYCLRHENRLGKNKSVIEENFKRFMQRVVCVYVADGKEERLAVYIAMWHLTSHYSSSFFNLLLLLLLLLPYKFRIFLTITYSMNDLIFSSQVVAHTHTCFL